MNDDKLAIWLVQLAHQNAAIDDVLAAIAGVEGGADHDYCANPRLLPTENIDVKMETGTGKTYVYTRLMFALHQRFGLFKFIIVVPSLAIKEGTKNFIVSDYAKQHFQQFYPGKRINLQLINAGDFTTKNGRRKMFPPDLTQYVDATRNEQNSINCLLLNAALLDKAGAKIYDADFDQTLFDGTTCPADAIRQTRPVVIIDEPHRFKTEGKAYDNIMNKFAPQLVIRFGATFAGEYFRGAPVNELGAVQAINSGLVKAIDVVYPSISNVSAPEQAVRYKVSAINSGGGVKSVVFQKVGSSGGGRELRVGDTLSLLDSRFGGDITLDHVKSKTKAFLSNEIELGIGTQFYAETFSATYQELLIQQALDEHFEKEEANFLRPQSGVNAPRIKTISLFFIDSIASYRDADGWLKTTFEKLLTAKLERLLARYKNAASQREAEYGEFLQATRQNLAGAHGGYFAQDWGEPDDSAVAEEREDILHKERTLTFRKSGGAWNTRRFFFSKWTLREGWDNPNVFVICKLRSSGSETSKLQEVGRGLRLPVDERGNRLAEEEFRLTYLIDYAERGFAETLVGEINSSAAVKLDADKVTEKTVRLILQSQGANIQNMDEKTFAEKQNEILEKLDGLGVIKRDNSFKEGGYEKMLAAYPKLEETLRVQKGKVTESANGKAARPKVKLRLHNWEKIRGFWEKVTRRYMLEFERLKEGELEQLLDGILSGDAGSELGGRKSIFVRPRIEAHTDRVRRGEGSDGELTVSENIKFLDSALGTLTYGEFLRQIHRQTVIPLALLQRKISARVRELQITLEDRDVAPFLNTTTVGNFVAAFQRVFQKTFAQKYKYSGLDFSAKTSVFADSGVLLTELEAGVVGASVAAEVADDERNLYEPPFWFDSELEREVLKLVPQDEVVVFGKLPRRSIKVPTYTGGTTTPDFVFAIKREGESDITLHLIVETKAQDLRGAEQNAIAAQMKLFKNIPTLHWTLENFSSDLARTLQNLIENKAQTL